MKYSCELVKDLLPLYHDKVCSEDSSEIVEEHLQECDLCKAVLKKINDSTYDDRLQEEREDVVSHYATKIKRKSLLAGLCIAAFLAVPILICLIINIAVGHALDWFFIVLTGLLILASVTVVPLVVEEKKGLWTLGSFTVSLILLLLTCCIYSNGNWFFITVIPALFGLSVVFLPYIIRQIPLTGFAARNKGLIVMVVDTILLFAVIVVCGLYGNDAGFWKPALLNTIINVAFVWIIFVIIRYLKTNGLVKAGLCVILTSIFTSFINNIINWINDGVLYISLADVNLSDWSSDILINANLYCIILVTGFIIGVALLVAGLVKKSHRR